MKKSMNEQLNLIMNKINFSGNETKRAYLETLV